jgi:hypothetical protein
LNQNANERRKKMKTTKILAMMVAVVLITAWSQMVFAEEKLITLQKGTKVEKLGPGHFKFKLPDGQAVEVKGYSKGSGTTAIIGDSGIYDRTGKLIASGKQGSLKSGPKPKEFIKESKNYVKIDDDVTWLPATITFKLIGIVDPEPPPRPLDQTKTKGLSPQPDPPGKK